MKDSKIGLTGAVSIGIGGMVGGGIFAVLGEAVSLAHGATPVAFLFAGTIALLTACSYADLSVTYPSQGGTVVFIENAFGTGLIPKGLNMMLWLSYLVTLSLYAVAFASYGVTFFKGVDQAILKHALISLGILVPVAVNLLNSDLVSRSETLIVIVKMVLLGVIICTGLGYVEPGRFSPSSYGSALSIVSAGMMIFVAYEGFELIANASAEVKNPSKNLPRAFYLSVIIVVLLYVVIAVITVGAVPESVIKASQDFALAEAARPALGQLGFRIVAVSALLATLSAINATIYGNARLGFLLATERELPAPLKMKVWRDSYTGVIIVGALSLIMANTVDLTAISIIASAGFLLIFAAVNLAACKLAKKTAGHPRVSGLGALLSMTALILLLVNTWETRPHAIYIFFGFVFFALLFELVYGRFSSPNAQPSGEDCSIK